MSSTSRPVETLQPVAGFLAFLLPGLGHIWLREARRGVMILIGVLGLFFGGLLIGGVDAVDSREDFWWFVAQAGVGPVAVVTDRIHQTQFKVADPRVAGGARSARPDENPTIRKSLGHVNEIGALYAAIAGMLNTIAIIDAIWRRPRGVAGVVGSVEART